VKSLVAIVSLASACTVTPNASSPQPPPPPPQQAPVLASEIGGYWTGDWGELVLREVDGEIRGVYSHDQGTVTGTFDGGVFRGWWCEVPSRSPSGDAGDVEFRFSRGSDALALDGRWRYGSEGEWREDWDLGLSAGTPPAPLSARFDDAGAFCRAPHLN
jgi:hypothetical protein